MVAAIGPRTILPLAIVVGIVVLIVVLSRRPRG
jgi:hypothetical protein